MASEACKWLQPSLFGNRQPVPVGDDYDPDTWRTPTEVFKLAEKIMGQKFNFDAACTTENKMCEHGAFFDQGISGLDVQWGSVTWCNPPYSDIEPWILKAALERDRLKKSCLLIPCDPSTKNFRLCVDLGAKIYMISGRLAFLHPVTGKPIHGIKTGSMLVVFEKFAVGKICVIDRP